MQVRNLVTAMEAIAPPQGAEDWDNVGLLIGDPAAACKKILLCIDLTEPVLDEAIAKGCQAVVAYHPVIFKPVTRITPDETPVAYRALKEGLAVYSPHTALDIAAGGTNDVLAQAMELTEVRPLIPTQPSDQAKIVVFVPPSDLDAVAAAAFQAGSGRIGLYDHCSFRTPGTGTFRGLAGSDPAIGQAGQDESTQELRLEICCPTSKIASAAAAIRQAHSYQTPAIDIYPVQKPDTDGLGMGRIGQLPRPIELEQLVAKIKRVFGMQRLLLVRGQEPRASGLLRCLAVTAGSCGGAWQEALAAGADLYLTGELRHHDALAAAAAGLHVVALCHSNSERIALRSLARRIEESLGEIETIVSDIDADPFAII